MSILGDALAARYEEVFWDGFYQEIFHEQLGSSTLDAEGALTSGAYIGIATVIRTVAGNGSSAAPSTRCRNYFVYSGLDTLDGLVNDDWTPHPRELSRLTIISPISYAGNRRLSSQARFIFALCVEIDGMRTSGSDKTLGLRNLEFQFEHEIIPRPTFIVASGNGVHLYYLFDKPLACFPHVTTSLSAYKRDLTTLLWNRDVTFYNSPDKIQYESLFQGFRMVGTRTKAGDRVQAFRVGEPVTVDYLNRWAYIPRNNRDKRPNSSIVAVYKHEGLTLADAKARYPDWYERRIVRGEARGHWTCNRAVYDWWKARIEDEALFGHRYFCLMCLCIYAVKCQIEESELEADCFRLMHIFDQLTPEGSDNVFDERDVNCALQLYYDRGLNLVTSPINYISERSGLVITKNKRNGRKQSDHMKLVTLARDLMYPDGLWRNIDGAPDKWEIVNNWRSDHPDGRKADCIKETGLSKNTVYKWWDAEDNKAVNTDVNAEVGVDRGADLDLIDIAEIAVDNKADEEFERGNGAFFDASVLDWFTWEDVSQMAFQRQNKGWRWVNNDVICITDRDGRDFYYGVLDGNADDTDSDN